MDKFAFALWLTVTLAAGCVPGALVALYGQPPAGAADNWLGLLMASAGLK
jgi:hypothetical protein